MFKEEWDKLQNEAYETAKKSGFHEGERNLAEMIALMHSELSEALEALRVGNPTSEKLPSRSHVEEEFADVVIRIMNMAAYCKYDIASAILDKMAYNKTRPFKHGGKKF